MEASPAIFVHNLSLHLGEAKLLTEATFQVAKGARLGIIGPAAAGKSVLLKLLVGLLRPTTGIIRIFGTEIQTASEKTLQRVRQDIGMLFQNSALFDSMTVAENVAFPLRREGTASDSEIGERVHQRLKAVGLANHHEKYPSELSGGMKRRVGIARATITNPLLLLYDEPTSGLDPVTTSKIYDLIRKDQEETGCTVVVVSSDVDALLSFADSLLLLHKGEIHFNGSIEEIRSTNEPLVHQFISGSDQGPL